MLATVTAETFTRFVSQSLSVKHEGGEEFLTLSQVQHSKYAPHINAGRQPFSLFLTGPANGIIRRQGTYSVTFPELGPLDIFMVPVAVVGDNALRFQAVFS